ncbi:MAG: hypothetical protein AB8G05_16560 [Oligoflexales bacterium]
MLDETSPDYQKTKEKIESRTTPLGLQSELKKSGLLKGDYIQVRKKYPKHFITTSSKNYSRSATFTSFKSIATLSALGAVSSTVLFAIFSETGQKMWSKTKIGFELSNDQNISQIMSSLKQLKFRQISYFNRIFTDQELSFWAQENVK